jgi:hypothetical protein
MSRAQLTVDGHMYKVLVYKERKKEKDKKDEPKKKEKAAKPGRIRDFDDNDDNDDDDDHDDDGAEDYEHPNDDDVDDNNDVANANDVAVAQSARAPTASERWPAVSVSTLAACAQAQQAIAAHKLVALGVIGDVKSDSSSFVRLVSVAVMTEPSLATADVAQAADVANVSRGTVFVFDLHSDVETMLAIHKMLAYLLKDDDVTKVMCDARHALPALKLALRLATTEVNNIYDTLIAYHSMRRILDRAPPAAPHAPSRLTAIDAQLALALPLTVLSDALPTGGTLWHSEALLDVQREFAAERVRYLLPLRARIQLELAKAIERTSDVTVRWFSLRKRIATLEVLPSGEVLAMAFESDPRGDSVLHLVAHRGAPYQQPSAEALTKATEARWRGAAEASRAEVLALLDALPSVLRAAALRFADNDPIVFAARVQAIFFGVGQPARLQLRGRGDFEILRECVWSADQFKQFQLQLGEKGLMSAAVDVVPLRRSLHRLAIRRENGAVIGLKCRVVLAFTGAISLLRDVVTQVSTSQKALLIFGDTQAGKTTVLRELSQELAYTRRTVVVDTYGDIGGDSATRHASLGDAMVLRVAAAGADADGVDRQTACMQEALHNWSAECVVVDELTWESQIECVAALKVSDVGVVCGARAQSLATLYEEFAVLQSNNPFDAMIEVHDYHRFTLHTTQATTAAAVAAILPVSERWYDATAPEQRWIRCSSTTAAFAW